MLETMRYVGLDVHARSTHAAAIDVRSGELRRARFGRGSDEAIAWLQTLSQPLKGCYEAGPTGFALDRAAEAAGLSLEVIAPSKTPRAPGDRIKTDRKDAELVARLLPAGRLKAVTVPPPAFEAARHLARAREQVRGDLMRCRHRVSKLLLLHGRVYQGGAWTRFPRPAKLASWLGLVPSLDQSGESRRQGAITKTGSGYARRLLVEAAWHYLPRPSEGPTIAARPAGQPDHVIQTALRAERRLHRLYHRLRERGKPGNLTTVAVARELACFLWAAAEAD